MEQIIIDGDGITLHEGDRVFTYDIYNGKPVRAYGTLKLSEYPEVSKWCVDYDDGESCAVLDEKLIFKA